MPPKSMYYLLIADIHSQLALLGQWLTISGNTRVCSCSDTLFVANPLTVRAGRFTLTPQRMRMIVEAFKDTLELGLQKPEQVVVRFPLPSPMTPIHITSSL